MKIKQNETYLKYVSVCLCVCQQGNDIENYDKLALHSEKSLEATIHADFKCLQLLCSV